MATMAILAKNKGIVMAILAPVLRGHYGKVLMGHTVNNKWQTRIAIHGALTMGKPMAMRMAIMAILHGN